MFQWQWTGWISFGIHIDLRTRINAIRNEKYGPYVDFHFGCFILSIGRNPVRSGEIDLTSNCGRGGEQ